MGIVRNVNTEQNVEPTLNIERNVLGSGFSVLGSCSGFEFQVHGSGSEFRGL
jgi:hypothetical protein